MSAGGVARSLGWLRRHAAVLGAASAYLLIVCLLYWPVAPWSNTMVLDKGRADPPQMIWWLEWVSWAVVHGLNPFFTNYLDVPRGADVLVNTSTPLLGLLAAPVTLLVGPISTFNLLMRIGWAGSGFTMFLLMRRWTGWWPAAFLGGALVLLNPYMFRQSSTHLNLVFLVIPPLILMVLDRLLLREPTRDGPGTGRRRTVLLGVVLGVLATAQWFISAELFVDCVLMTFIGLVVLSIARPRQVRPRLAVALPGLLAGGVVMAVLLAYPVWFFLDGPQHLVGPVAPTWLNTGYRTDLVGPVVRNIAETTRPPAWVVAQHRYSASPLRWDGNDAFLGLPMLVIIVAAAVVAWPSRRVRFFSLMAVIAFVLSLGSHLTIDGHTTDIPLPGGVFSHFQLLDNLVPQRMIYFFWVFSAVVLAVGLDEARRRLMARTAAKSPASLLVRAGPGADLATAQKAAAAEPTPPGRQRTVVAQLASAVLVGVVAASFIPVVAGGVPRQAIPVADRLAASVIAQETPPGGVVLFLPPVTPATDRPMLWQADSAMAYRIVGGYAIVPHSSYESRSVLPPTTAMAQLWAAAPNVHHPGAPPPGPPQAYAACVALPSAIEHYHVDTIVVWPNHLNHQAIDDALNSRLGPPQLTTEKLTIWTHVSGRVRPAVTCSSLGS